MRYVKKIRSAWLALLMLSLSVQLAPAGDVRSGAGASTTDDLLQVLDLGETLSTDELDFVTGRLNIEIDDIDIQLSNTQQDAKMDGNLLHSGRTGANTITQDAFSNAQGIATVIQNSGNQVIINNALIVNMLVE